MMSILGCSAGELGNVLQALGFRLDRVRRRRLQPSRRRGSCLLQPRADSERRLRAAGRHRMQHPTARRLSALGPEAPAPEAAAGGDTGNACGPVTGCSRRHRGVDRGCRAGAGAASTPPRPKWDEIWRPRRQGRRPPRPARQRYADAKSPPGPDEARQAGPGPPQRRAKPRTAGASGRSGAAKVRASAETSGPRAFMQSAAPPPKGGVDPDSPFAALYALKAALEKPSPGD